MPTFAEHLAALGVDTNDEAAAEAVSSLTNALPVSAPKLKSVFSDAELKDLETLRKTMNDDTKSNQEKAQAWANANMLTTKLAKAVGFIL